VLTNPPPSSGGSLIAFALELLDRLGAYGTTELIAVMAEAQAARTPDFIEGLNTDGFAASFLDPAGLDAAAARIRSGVPPPGAGGGAAIDRLGSTTHLTAVDSQGRCASLTCSNGTGSGLIVPGTGVHLNNMLGEQDLNPLGFHRLPAGSRMPSMMSPTVLLRDGELEAGLGSAGSNRIRSAVTQTILRLVVDGLDAQAAIDAPRAHFEAGTIHAEPGVDDAALDAFVSRGLAVQRWDAANLFFGGVQAVARDVVDGGLSAGCDSRRGGAVAWA